MSSLYTREVGLILRRNKKPFPFVVDVVEVDTGEFLNLVVYADEILALDDTQRHDVMLYLLKVRDEIQALGVRCEIAGRDATVPTPKRGTR